MKNSVKNTGFTPEKKLIYECNLWQYWVSNKMRQLVPKEKSEDGEWADVHPAAGYGREYSWKKVHKQRKSA